MKEFPCEINVGSRGTLVSGLWLVPDEVRVVYVLAHGAGAGMRHKFMESMARRLADRGVATLRYNFPYMDEGRRRPDVPGKLVATVRGAVAEARRRFPEVPTVAGGKSMGGRMTSTAQAGEQLEGVEGLVFLGFPLHPPGKEGVSRADHLERVSVPCLFVQGTRDKLARMDLMESVVDRLGKFATIHVVEGADHSFAVLKRSGRTADEVHDEIAASVRDWALRL